MGIFIGAITWIFLGVCGYLMMRQGFLAEFEGVLGRRDAWGRQEQIASLVGILSGPMIVFWALVICGRYCFYKR